MGWYFSDMYIDKAPSVSAKGAEFFLDKDFKSSSSSVTSWEKGDDSLFSDLFSRSPKRV